MSSIPLALTAARLSRSLRRRNAGKALIVMSSEREAESLAELLGQLSPEDPAFYLPGWDCLPFARASPSAEVMGRRMRVLRQIRSAPRAIVVAATEAALQRVPPGCAAETVLTLTVGQPLDLDALSLDLARLGYVGATDVDEPGRFAIRGEVADIYPADDMPYRISLTGGAIGAVRRFDPVSQRTTGEDLPDATVGPVSEIVDQTGTAPRERTAGDEQRLYQAYPDLATVLSYLPGAVLVVEPSAEVRASGLIGQLGEPPGARDGPPIVADGLEHGAALAAGRLYLTAAEWQAQLEQNGIAFPEAVPFEAVPRFCLQGQPARTFAAYVGRSRSGGQRVVLAGGTERELAGLGGRCARATGEAPRRVETWDEVLEATPGSIMIMRLAAEVGYCDPTSTVSLIAAPDLLGSRRVGVAAGPTFHGPEERLRFGDVVIHLDHGVGVAEALEPMGERAGGEALRIGYAEGVSLLVPTGELHRVWRYGGAGEGLSLDRLDSDAWMRRRSKIVAGIAETARDLVRLAKRREEAEAEPIVPPRAEYERFASGFAFVPTPDQGRAIEDVLQDLGRRRPMDRLVVGDVGFGKTEVALRAAAAAVLAGRQVAVVTPTTVLARQHSETFGRRFAALGIEVAHLSRLIPAGEAKRVRAGLADGSIRLVVGTQAVAGKGVSFADLGLMIVDEEHRFGAAQKAKLKQLGAGVHLLTLSATPIPRTLQTALVGLQDLSVIATAPARRRPVRTLVAAYDRDAIRAALLNERARGGQSFVVAPRIGGLEALEAELKELLPSAEVMVAHGRMAAQDVDRTMVGFGAGRGDVLLATSIIESGLDVPRANTMIVVGADRFGMAQLHQLRGRVGRGQRQAICCLMTEPSQELTAAAAERLRSLSRSDRLGSGLEISARDLDLRGAGDLTGEEQAGHVRLIGLGLYQRILQRSLAEARGEPVEDWEPELRIDGSTASLPPSYIPDPAARLEVYSTLSRVGGLEDADEIAEELADRFGALSEPVEELIAALRLKATCRRHGVTRVDAGPKALAFDVRPGDDPRRLLEGLPAHLVQDAHVKAERLIVSRVTSSAE